MWKRKNEALKTVKRIFVADFKKKSKKYKSENKVQMKIRITDQKIN